MPIPLVTPILSHQYASCMECRYDASGREDATGRVLYAAQVVVGEAAFRTPALFGAHTLSVRRFDAAQDDVLAAELLDLFLCLYPHPRPQRAWQNRAHAKHDAEHGEKRAQPLQPASFESQRNGAPYLGEAEQGSQGLEVKRCHCGYPPQFCRHAAG